HNISQRDLQKGKVAAVGYRRNADKGKRAGFGGYDRKEHCPPGDVAAAEEIIGGRCLTARNPDTDAGDANQIDHNDYIINKRKFHAITRFLNFYEDYFPIENSHNGRPK